MTPLLPTQFLIIVLTVLLSHSIAAGQTSESLSKMAQRRLQTHYLTLTGVANRFSLEDCPAAIETFQHCLGANPAAPYVVPIYETHPNEYVDPNYPSLTEKTVNGRKLRAPTRIHPTEARVFLLNMPERAAYFGFQTYLFSKQGQPYSGVLSSWLPTTYHPNQERVSIFNSISNSINNVTIAHQLDVAEAWNQPLIAIISSSDAQTIDDVKRALQAVGVPARHIFVEELETQASMGLGVRANDYIQLFRYALPEKESGKEFYDNPELLTFRVVAKSRSNLSPMSKPILDSRSGVDESALQLAQKELSARVSLALNLESTTTIRMISPLAVGIDTFLCDEANTNCLGETRDTDTYLASFPFQLQEDEVLVMTGVNHNLTGNGTYFSLSLVDDEEIRAAEMVAANGDLLTSLSQVGREAGFNEAFRSRVLEQSAQRVQARLKFRMSRQLKNNLSRLWVKVVTRNPDMCQGIGDCVILSRDRNRGVALEREIKVLRRVYIKPGTARGPDHDKLLNPILEKGLKAY